MTTSSTTSPGPPGPPGPAGATGPPRPDPCEVAGDPIDIPNYDVPRGQISEQNIRVAGVLMQAHQYVTRLHFHDAVRRAFELLDTDELCLDVSNPAQAGLVNRLACWPEREERVEGTRLARLQARTFGIPHPDVPEADRDTQIQGLLSQMLDAVSAVCDLGPFRTTPSDFDLVRLETRARAVQARLSSSVTGLTAYRVRELQRQLDSAQGIVTDVAEHLRIPCRPQAGTATGPGLWEGLIALVGPQLRADGTDIFEAAETAIAWHDVFDWLADYRTGSPPPDVCRAAAVLRPGSRRTTTATVTTS